MPSWGLALLRWTVGVVFIAHGLPKLLPIWGQDGLSGTAASFEALGLFAPYFMAIVVALVEIVGGGALIAGAYTAWASGLLICVMAVAAWKVHLPNGFFINWALTPGVGHGFEFNLVLAAALACLILAGPGALSFDARWRRHRESLWAGRQRLREHV